MQDLTRFVGYPDIAILRFIRITRHSSLHFDLNVKRMAKVCYLRPNE